MIRPGFMPRLAGFLAGTFLAISYVAPCRAQAQPAREWTRITDMTDANIFEPALARTADGVLHVVWLRKNGSNADFKHTAIGKDGKVTGAPVTVLDAWASLSNPDLIVTKEDGLRLLFGGQRTTDSKDPYSQGSLYSVTATAGGATWTLEKGAHAQSNAVTSSPVGAALLPDGTPAAAWAVSFALQAHLGLNSKTPDLKFQTACCSYQPDIAVDTVSGEAVLGWFSNATKENGLYTQTIAPKTGEKLFVPDSATPDRNSSLSLDQRMGIAARLGAPGVYIAYGAGYPTFKTVNLWKHGSADATIVAKADRARLVNISPGPEGRLWVMWERNRRAYAVRSNRAVTKFGPILEVTPPAGKAESGIYKVKGEGSLGPLDLFLACQSINELATYHTQVFPPLALSASPAKLIAEDGGTVTFIVSDVDDPVEGATVSVGGKALTTDAQGKATMTVPKGSKPGALAAIARKEGYTDGSAKITLAPKPPATKPKT
ncbi:MAG: hypothetical protein ACE145_00830 [Terriglobia bacterium]